LLTRVHLGISVLSLALCLGSGTSVSAKSHKSDNMKGSQMSSSGSMEDRAGMGINWSDRYRLTPLEHKRLRAFGLSDPEVFAVAKASAESGRDVDDVAQMVFRGRTYWQIADDLNIPYDSLFKWPARWQTPQWQDEVRAGSPVWIPNPEAMTPGSRGEPESPGRARRGGGGTRRGMTPGAERVSTATCPVCHMQLTTTASASAPKAVVISGKTYYCCAGCDMSKIQQ
jgi:hypothetical protein